MLNIIIFISVVLILAVLVVILRVSTLVQVIKGTEKKEKGPGSDNKVQAALMMAFLVLGIIGSFYYSFGGLDESFNQPIASEHGLVTERLFWIT